MIIDCAVYRDGVREDTHSDKGSLDAALAGLGQDDFLWIGIGNPTSDEMHRVAAALQLHPLAVEDALEAHQRPKVEQYEDHLFMHDLGIPHWGDVPLPMPTVVLTHEKLPDRPMTSGSFTYVSGIKPALARARELAGEQDVLLMGGPGVIRQYLSLGLVDEIRLSIAHLLLGGGLRLFEGIGNPPPRFEAVSSRSSSLATHLVLRTVR